MKRMALFYVGHLLSTKVWPKPKSSRYWVLFMSRYGLHETWSLWEGIQGWNIFMIQ
jgi:hypothetical protein